MPDAILLRVGTCFAYGLLLAHCGSGEAPSTCANAEGCPAVVGAGMGAVDVPAAGIAAPSGGATSTGAGAPASAGRPGSVCSPRGAAGMPSGGGAGAPAGAPVAGASPGSAGSSPQAGTGTSGTGGSAAPGGAGSPAAGSGATGDAQGVPLAKPGDSKTASREYLNLGDFRLLVNKWGSDELMCNTTMKVFVNTDASFGWSFDRGSCGGNKQKPDYPEIEFGIHPFGAGSSLATTPSYPSTRVLPIQIKDITSASVAVDGLTASIQGTTWNTDVEFWLSEKNPVTEADPGVYAEVIAFWGWQDSWACDQSGNVTAGDKTYSLCHQDDNWANGQWRYYQFRASDGSSPSYSGKVDIKAFLDWLVTTRGFSTELWLTRLEVGSELDDNTAGMVTLKNLTFQVNAASKSAQLGP
jgi:hypothetical protein